MKDLIMYTSGSFDLFHYGHLNLLQRAAQLGSELIVAVHTDEVIEQTKGYKPVMEFSERIKILKALAVVDMVIAQDSLDLVPLSHIKKYDIDYVIVGDDCKSRDIPTLRKLEKECRVIYVPYTKEISTSIIKKRIING